MNLGLISGDSVVIKEKPGVNSWLKVKLYKWRGSFGFQEGKTI
jgi:hypothetical protein